MRADITVQSKAGESVDYRIEGPDDASVAYLNHALDAASCTTHPSVVVEHAAIVGAVAAPEHTGGPTMYVLGGIDAGASMSFAPGTSTIGRGPEATHQLRDPELSRRHFQIDVGPRQVTIAELAVTNPASLNGERLTGVRALRAGDRISIGATVLAWGQGAPPATAPITAVEFPTPPQPRTRSTLGTIALLLPAVATVGVLGFAHTGPMLVLTVVTAVAMGFAVTLSGSPRGGRRARREYAAALRSAEQTLSQAQTDEQAARRLDDPGPGVVEDIARRDGPRSRVRLGLGRVEARVAVAHGPGDECHPQLDDVPICIDFPRGGLALQAPAEVARGQARWLLLQLVAASEPTELGVVLNLDNGSEAAWRWARWLPHLRAVTGIGPAGDGDPISPHGGQRLLVVADAQSLPTPGVHLTLGGDAGESTVSCTDDTGLRQVLLQPGRPGLHFHADTISVEAAERRARTMARHSHDSTSRGGGHLLDLLALPPVVTARTVEASWRREPGPMRTPIGRGATGTRWVDLDLDGPHALVGGTTGSGKSQLLRTLVLGLALRYPPSAVQFLLVDYKGGTAFGSCRDLPHTCGLLTDLDASLTARALRSLIAELRRRERLFRAAGVTEHAQWRPSAAAEAVPRLLVIVDEFATLATELPDFITGLVGIAQRGRALGMHLVLATQRPGGSVSADIRANANLRIALRTISAAESVDLIDCADAAALDPAQPGQAIRAGTPPQPFHVAHLGAERAPVSVRVRRLDPWGHPVREADDGHPAPLVDIEALVAATVEAARLTDTPNLARPWQPPLPTCLSFSALPEPVPGTATVGVGLIDLPDEQRQTRLDIDLDAGTTWILAGGPRSGRSGALLTIAAAAAASRRPDELHVHGFDFAGGSLSPLRRLPHLGTLATASQPVAVAAGLIARLSREAWRRRDGAGGPPLLLLIDDWPALATALDAHDLGVSTARLRELLELSRVARLSVVVCGNRGALSSALSALVEERFVLPCADPSDYQLAGIPPREVPADALPGRGLRARDAAQVQFVAPPGEWSVGGVPDPAAIRVRALPTAPRSSERPRRGGAVCLGVGGDSAEPVWLDLAHPTQLLVAGPARSGKTSLLCGVLEQVENRRVWVAARPGGTLARLATAAGQRLLDPTEAPACGEQDLLLIDDVDELTDTPLGDAITAIAGAGAATMIVTGAGDRLATAFRGPARAVRRWRRGILLQPSLIDGELMGLRLNRTDLGGPVGRGVAIGEPSWGWPTAAAGDGPSPIQTWAPEPE